MLALWLLPIGIYYWDFTFADDGNILFNANDSSFNNNMKGYSTLAIINNSGDESDNFRNIRCFARSVLVSNGTYGWAPFVPYCVNTSTGAIVNFQTNAIPVGRGDVNL